MAYIVYDGSFEGFLSVVFHCYQHKVTPNDICKETNFQDILFADKETVVTEERRAARVWKAIQKKLHKRNKQLLFKAFLSEEKGIELMLYRFIRRLLDSNFSIETD